MADDEPDPAMVALRRKIVEIEKDTTLSAAEKAVRRQQVMSAAYAPKTTAAEAAGGSGDVKGERTRRAASRRALAPALRTLD